MHFCDIFEPPQWGLSQPSKRNLVPFAHAYSGILVKTTNMAQICCAGANCICVMFVLTLTVNTEY